MPKPPIAPVLSHYGWDERASGHGPWQTTRCPVHNDRHPSARVNEDEELFRCFVCDINGDAYELVMKAECVDFPKAKELIKEWTGFDADSSLAGLAGAGSAQPGRVRSARLASSRLPAWARDRHSKRLMGAGR